MNDKTVYAKTPAGQQEIGERKAWLDIRQRRLLILVDGHRPVSELRALSGIPDVPALLEALQALGLVSVAAGGAAAAAPPAAPAATTAEASGDLHVRRRRGAHAINEMLGPMGEDLALKMEEARTVEVLEELLARGLRMVGEIRGKAAIQRFEQLLAED